MSEKVQRHKIGMETNLEKFCDFIREARNNLENKRDLSWQLVISMIDQLYDGNTLRTHNVPRKIHTVGELYSFKPEEILYGCKYGKKTWIKLNSVLAICGLPEINLPPEYTMHQLI